MIMIFSFIAPPPEHGWHLASAINFALIGQLNANFLISKIILVNTLCIKSRTIYRKIITPLHK